MSIMEQIRMRKNKGSSKPSPPPGASSSSSSDNDDEIPSSFINPVFEGKEGHKLLELQQRYADDRFKLTEAFRSDYVEKKLKASRKGEDGISDSDSSTASDDSDSDDSDEAVDMETGKPSSLGHEGAVVTEQEKDVLNTALAAILGEDAVPSARSSVFGKMTEEQLRQEKEDDLRRLRNKKPKYSDKVALGGGNSAKSRKKQKSNKWTPTLRYDPTREEDQELELSANDDDDNNDDSNDDVDTGRSVGKRDLYEDKFTKGLDDATRLGVAEKPKSDLPYKPIPKIERPKGPVKYVLTADLFRGAIDREKTATGALAVDAVTAKNTGSTWSFAELGIGEAPSQDSHEKAADTTALPAHPPPKSDSTFGFSFASSNEPTSPPPETSHSPPASSSSSAPTTTSSTKGAQDSKGAQTTAARLFGMLSGKTSLATDTGSVGGDGGRKTWAGAFFAKDSTELMAEPRESGKKKYKRKGSSKDSGGKGGDDSSKKKSVKLRDRVRKMASRKRHRRAKDGNSSGRSRRR